MYICIANSYESETLYFEQSSSEHVTEVFSLLKWHLIERANAVKISAQDFSNRLVPYDSFWSFSGILAIKLTSFDKISHRIFSKLIKNSQKVYFQVYGPHYFLMNSNFLCIPTDITSLRFEIFILITKMMSSYIVTFYEDFRSNIVHKIVT